jgi:hypothetical protein
VGAGTPGSFRNIVMEPDFSDPNIPEVLVWISDTDPNVNSTTQCNTIFDQEHITYWHLVRSADANYARTRSGFIIDPNYTGPDPIGSPNTAAIPYGLDAATLDVDVTVMDDIVIPNGKTFTVTTDNDIINSPYVEQTEMMFEAGTGLTVQGGGTLIGTHFGPFGVVDWFCPGNQDKGGWRGIRGEAGATITMTSQLIIGAETGLYLEQVSASQLEAVSIQDSRDKGLHIRNCSPTVEMSAMVSTGEASQGYPGVNVFVEGRYSMPTFTSTWMKDAIRVNQGGTWYGGHGVELTGAGYSTFTQCVALDNEQYGFYIHRGGGATKGPYLDNCRIADNRTGIYINQVSNWTTLRNSSVYGHGNGFGILLEGSSGAEARIRGWWHYNDALDYPLPSEVDWIISNGYHEGRNCIYSNNLNAVSYTYGRFDLGSEYLDGAGVYRTLGGINSLFWPGVTQGYVDWNSHGGFREVWWDGNYSMSAYNNSTLDMSNELQMDEVGCTEFGKSTSGSESPVSELLRYRRTRGGMAAAAETPASHRPVAPSSSDISLSPAYPNPFNPVTTVSVMLYSAQSIELYVTDALGRRVATLTHGHYEAGRYSVDFRSATLPSGVYFIVLRGASAVQTQQILLTK